MLCFGLLAQLVPEHGHSHDHKQPHSHDEKEADKTKDQKAPKQKPEAKHTPSPYTQAESDHLKRVGLLTALSIRY